MDAEAGRTAEPEDGNSEAITVALKPMQAKKKKTFLLIMCVDFEWKLNGNVLTTIGLTPHFKPHKPEILLFLNRFNHLARSV